MMVNVSGLFISPECFSCGTVKVPSSFVTLLRRRFQSSVSGFRISIGLIAHSRSFKCILRNYTLGVSHNIKGKAGHGDTDALMPVIIQPQRGVPKRVIDIGMRSRFGRSSRDREHPSKSQSLADDNRPCATASGTIEEATVEAPRADGY
jgi:hypothetical protein